MAFTKKFFFATLLVALMSVCSVSQAHILDGAKEWNGHYYKAFEFQLNWDQAKKFCESMGGHLATAENFNENSIIQELVDVGGKKEYFLGGYKDNKEIWRWITGGIITDTNWQSGYPSYGPYMSMEKKSGSKWKTTYFWGEQGKYPFICEWDSANNAHESNM